MNLDLVNFFLNHLQVERRLSQHTLTSYSTDLIQFCTFIEEGLPQAKTLIDLNAKDIRLWIVDLSNQSIENRSINRKLATLRTFFKYLQRTEKIIENPMVSIKAVKVGKTLPQFLREPETAKITFQAQEENFHNLREELVYSLFYGTGMRLSELIHLKINQIDPYRKQIKVMGKRNKERIIPAPSFLFEVIEKYLEKCPFESEYLLVTDQGKPLYPMMVQRMVKKLLGNVSTLEKLSPHVLRHTYATHLLNKGADLNAIKELLGHANLAATQVYTHNSLEKIKEIYQQAHPKGS